MHISIRATHNFKWGLSYLRCLFGEHVWHVVWRKIHSIQPPDVFWSNAHSTMHSTHFLLSDLSPLKCEHTCNVMLCTCSYSDITLYCMPHRCSRSSSKGVTSSSSWGFFPFTLASFTMMYFPSLSRYLNQVGMFPTKARTSKWAYMVQSHPHAWRWPSCCKPQYYILAVHLPMWGWGVWIYHCAAGKHDH